MIFQVRNAFLISPINSPNTNLYICFFIYCQTDYVARFVTECIALLQSHPTTSFAFEITVLTALCDNSVAAAFHILTKYLACLDSGIMNENTAIIWQDVPDLVGSILYSYIRHEILEVIKNTNHDTMPMDTVISSLTRMR